MEYEATYGKVKPYDYVVVVTNDYMHRRTDITIGVVGDDGYVYTGITYVGSVPKLCRRQIGSYGCPVCKISVEDIPEKTIRLLTETMKLKKQLQGNNTVRKFDVVIIETLRDSKGEVVKTNQFQREMKTLNLPKDAPWSEVYGRLEKNINRPHYQYGCGAYITNVNYVPPMQMCGGLEVANIRRSFYVKEEGFNHYRDRNGDPVEVNL